MRRAGLAAAALLVAAGAPAGGLTFSWNTFGSGAFNDPNNWFPFGIPTVNDFVNFQVGSGNPYTVTFPGNPLVIGGVSEGGGGGAPASYFTSHLRVRDLGLSFKGSTQANRSNSSYTVASPTTTEANRGIVIGQFGGDNASLSLIHTGFTGGFFTSLSGTAATLGDAAGAVGTLNVNVGAFNVTGSDPAQQVLLVGNRGTGTLNVNGGADVNVLGFNSHTTVGNYDTGVGTVNISGTGSTWTSANKLWIGGAGDGHLTVQNGGTLINNGTGGTDGSIIGTFTGSNSSATITGPGSLWENNTTLTVGNSGNGSLTISNGGLLLTLGAVNYHTAIGSGSGTTGTVTVTGDDSTWSTNSTVTVGDLGAGTLSILNGGFVTTGTATIRGLNGGSGHVTVGGNGSTWNLNNRSLTVGLPEPGFTTGATSLTINPGGKVETIGDVVLNAGSTVNLQGGTLEAGAIFRTVGSPFFFTGGTLTTSFFDGNLTNAGGTLAPGTGFPIGGTTITGMYNQQADAALDIDIASPAFPGSFPERDFVSVDSFASLGGELQLTLLDDYVPTGTEDPFAIFSAGTLNGAFSNVANNQRLTTTDGHGSFLVHYGSGSPFNANQVVLSAFQAVAGILGDYNNSGLVEQGDLDQVLQNWGAGFASIPASWVNQRPTSGIVDQAELDKVLQNWGDTSAPDFGGSSVPEPGTLALLGTAVLAVSTRRRPMQDGTPPSRRCDYTAPLFANFQRTHDAATSL